MKVFDPKKHIVATLISAAVRDKCDKDFISTLYVDLTNCYSAIDDERMTAAFHQFEYLLSSPDKEANSDAIRRTVKILSSLPKDYFLYRLQEEGLTDIFNDLAANKLK